MDTKLQIPRPERSPSIASSRAPPPSYISRADDASDSDFEPEAQDPDTLGFDVRNDGRGDVNCHAPLGRRLSRLIGNERSASQEASSSIPPAHRADEIPPPKLNIVIQVAGSRGDVQPFIALGCALQRGYGHRVRLATHAAFEDFVRSSGLEFYPLGGDPAELMAYIVKNPGIIPSFASIKAGDIGRKREMLGEMLEGCWKSCIEKDQVTGAPFVAEAIIANPPSMGHVHCAQALSIPLHIMFTMPWSSTRSFSHPLANLNISADTNLSIANLLSFGVVEFMMWQGIGDIVNRWRSRSLDLEPIIESDGPKLLEKLAVPHTYCWSPALVPRPSDWPEHIDVCGFFFRDPPTFEPPGDLAAFLANGTQPIYIGFESIVIEDPKALTDTILEALKLTGTRALISRGWSKLGQGYESSDKVFFLDDCPHEWLFSLVAAVVHHGGAGTTACGLANGAPTLIVPFFGDQPFWGNMVGSAGAGPQPITYRSLTVENLSRAIVQCLDPETRSSAQALAAKMKAEDGVRTAVASFHRYLPRDIQCQVLPDQAAAWTYKSNRTNIRLSKRTAGALIKASILKPTVLTPFRSKPFIIEPKRWDPVTAVLSASFETAGSFGRAASEMASRPRQAHGVSKFQETDAAVTSSKEKVPSGASSPVQKSESGSGRAAPETERGELVPIPSQQPKRNQQLVYTSAAKTTGRLLLSPVKGLVVDIPLAVTEGFRALPQLYGDHSYSDRKPITDWKSGSIVGAQSFADGIRQGTSDIFSQTFARKKQEGAKGVAKGLGMGLVSLTAKTSAAAIGLIAYPCQGIYRSIYTATHRATRDLVEEAKQEEAHWMRSQTGDKAPDIVQAFLRYRSAL